MTNYRRGADHERRAKSKLEAAGFFVVRSAGSHSPVDLVAFKEHTRPLFIQCGLGGKSKGELAELAVLAGRYDAMAVFIGRGLTLSYPEAA